MEGYMEYEINDFYMNAGILGFIKVLKNSNAIEGKDYIIKSNKLYVNEQYIKNTDITSAVFSTFINKYGKYTKIQVAYDLIEKIMNSDNISEEEFKNQKKIIIDTFTAASIVSGYESIKNKMNFDCNLICEIKAIKNLDFFQTKEVLTLLKTQLYDKKIRETFYMKNIAYTIINKFWNGICFLNTHEAKNEMSEVYEKQFINDMINEIDLDKSKLTKICIECNEKYKNEKNISMLSDTYDDLARKKSAFWNFKPDTFICPKCAFVYSLVPLGFRKIGSEFVFINTNDNIYTLLQNNKDDRGIIPLDETENQRSFRIYTDLIQEVVKNKYNEIDNIQVITRKTVTSRGNDKEIYDFNVVGKDIITMLKISDVEKRMTKMSKEKVVKINNEYINLYEIVLKSILKRENLYNIINLLLKNTIENQYVINRVEDILYIQLLKKGFSYNMKGEIEMKKEIIEKVSNNAFALGTELVNSSGKGADSQRGVVYQLLNALQVGNSHKFMDIILRLYVITKRQVPKELYATLSEENSEFLDVGYAFVMGLVKGTNISKGNEGENK